MERALHPELAKRMVSPDSRDISRLNQMSAMTLVHYTKQVAVLTYRRTSNRRTLQSSTTSTMRGVVKILASGWVDYLEEVKFNGQWKIINVLWELKTAGSSKIG